MNPLFAATWPCGRSAVNTAWRYWASHCHPTRSPICPNELLLDAVERGVVAVEMNHRVNSVGRGGLPNCLGQVELDAAWMEGNQLRAGGVAGLRNFLPAISIARRVMECTPHILLVGKGAERFATGQGFRRQRLLAREASRRWREWKRKRRDSNSVGSSGHDTVGVIGWHQGHVVVACSTSGTPWKLPGRVGDSPLLGAGLYADDRAGAAVATGLGEEILRFTLTSRVVEAMRRGASAKQACEQAIRFMTKRKPSTTESMVAVLAVRKDGQYGIASTRKGFTAYIRSDGRRISRL
ncbi:MAG TPA: isoaspartyl peptidase/L-asparaginase [Verrucomicrobiae bacterium]|nr:isoaspartyl peptidase/L-asparaginase [Verrucomicrobiae bacterium]